MSAIPLKGLMTKLPYNGLPSYWRAFSPKKHCFEAQVIAVK